MEIGKTLLVVVGGLAFIILIIVVWFSILVLLINRHPVLIPKILTQRLFIFSLLSD